MIWAIPGADFHSAARAVVLMFEGLLLYESRPPHSVCQEEDSACYRGEKRADGYGKGAIGGGKNVAVMSAHIVCRRVLAAFSFRLKSK